MADVISEKDFTRAVGEFERLGWAAIKLREIKADLDAREAALAGAEKKRKAAEDAADSANAQVAAKQNELAGLERSIMVVNERLKQDKDKAREDFDSFVAGIKAEEKAIDAARRKKQAEFDDFSKTLTAKAAEAKTKFDKMVADHEKWRRAHGV